MTLSTQDVLKGIRKQLLEAMDAIDEHNFAFETIFSDDDRTPARVPSVVVNVQLRARSEDVLYRWEVRIDYHLPVSGVVEDATKYARWASQAAEKALWADDLVHGHAWTTEQLRAIL